MREAASKASAAHGVAEVSHGDLHAIAHPLIRAGEGEDETLGAMAVAREGEPFGAGEKEVLRYLIGQASVSVENIGLHERVAEQAATDALTGLANNRHFREWIDRESQRIGRFGGDLSLVLLDVDDFKQVNDTYGHLQGDEVLKELGRILQLESRGIDESARYGGEEFVLALPETPKGGAIEVAERVRERIASTEVQGVDGNAPLAVTASIGVASMPEDGADSRSLIAAADAALYEAKRSGKNRVVAAGGR
jgi:diguanylate cyclase (GGDEF)-like protein